MEQLTEPRQLRALNILSQGEAIKKVKLGLWNVASQTGVGKYDVTRPNRKWKCSCPDFENRQLPCKHIYAVQFSLKLKGSVKEDAKAEDITIDEERPQFCPSCGSYEIIKRGKRKTKFGANQIFGCKDCGHRFSPDKGFKHMKHSPEVITLTLDLFFKGLSLRKICDHLKQFHSISVNPTTPMRWIKKYLHLLAGYAEKHKADVGKNWHSDEMTIFIKKEGEKKYYEWIWNIMDADTRFLLACRVSKSRLVPDARVPLQDAKYRAKQRPDAIVTDGLQSYNKAIPAEFYDRHAMVKNPHVRYATFQDKLNNNIVERLNGSVRERMKVMRSMDSVRGAVDFTDFYRVYYNYLRPHQGIGGLTPAQLAKLPLDLSGNRWLKMIEKTVK